MDVWQGDRAPEAMFPGARRQRSRGQGLVEYVLIILFVALAVVLALTLLAPQISAIFYSISSAL